MNNISNINIERTLQEFDIDVLKLKPSSCKPVYRICEICKKQEIVPFRRINTQNSIKCSDCSNTINANTNKEQRNQKIKDNWVKNGHPRKGVKHTLEAIEKMRRNRKPSVVSIETRKKISESNKGEKNHFYGKKHSEKSLEKMRSSQKLIAKRGEDSPYYGIPRTQEVKDKIRQKLKDIKYSENFGGKNSPMYGKVTKPKRCLYLKDGKEFYFRSGWELKIAQYLDKNKIAWSYESQSFPIVYEHNGIIKNGTYIPDFFLKDEIWEIKGYWRKDAEQKYKAFLEQYPDIKIKLLQKQEIKSLGIRL